MTDTKHIPYIMHLFFPLKNMNWEFPAKVFARDFK